METVNVWDTNLNKNATYIYDIGEVINLIKSGEIKSFEVKDKFTPGNQTSDMLEELFTKNDFQVIYVDKDHPFLKGDLTILPNIISTEMFNKYKEQIREAFVYQLLNEDWKVELNPFVFSHELLVQLIEKGFKCINFVDVLLTDEEIKLLRDNLVSSELKKNGKTQEISTKYIIGNKTLEDVRNNIVLLLNYKDLDNIYYPSLSKIPNGKIIKMVGNNDLAEKERLTKLKKFLDELDKTGNNYSITFTVDSRKTFNDIFKKKRYQNINIVINNDLNDYSYEEYLQEEDKLDKLIEPIIKANLSPLERFLAVYNITKNFKPYKENEEEKMESRRLKYILNNEYMVCVSFASLLITLCDKVGIKCNYFSVNVDTSYDNGYSLEEKVVEKAGHARVMVSIDDSKYKVHGIYISDPTWDNDLSRNLLNHALMTYEKVASSSRMIFFDLNRPLLDIHSFNDFILQVNYYLKKMMEKTDLLNSYSIVIKNILSMIECDKETKKFYKLCKKCKTEEDYSNLLTILGHYLVTRINKPISSETIIKASMTGEKAIKGLSDEEVEKRYQKTKEDYDRLELEKFRFEGDTHIRK